MGNYIKNCCSVERSINNELIMQFYNGKSNYVAYLHASQLESQKLTNVKNLKLDKMICSVCNQYFEANEKIINLRCGHMFHNVCIRQYLEENPVCPKCPLRT